MLHGFKMAVKMDTEKRDIKDFRTLCLQTTCEVTCVYRACVFILPCKTGLSVTSHEVLTNQIRQIYNLRLCDRASRSVH